jgi:FAD/FMN-containing dehydrogenase
MEANVRTALPELQGFEGELITPGHPDYDASRAVWNGMIDRRPGVIARCVGTDDVIRCIEFARSRDDAAVSVRCGAHSVAGFGTNNGGIVIDLSRLKAIAVDPEARTATAGGGVTWGELDAATQRFGLATPGGVFSRTGIGGLTLGGGLGWLRNPYGLSCDNLIAAEVVTASGDVVHTHESENADLLWGLRGGGGNFGVVTEFTYRLHPVGPEVMFVFAFFDGSGENLTEAIRFYRDFATSAPDPVSSVGFAGVFPPGAEMFDAELHGRPFFGIGALHAGNPEEGRAALQPILDFQAPLADFSGVMPYVEAQQAFDEDYPDGGRYYWKSINVLTLDDDVIDVLARHARLQPSPHSTTDLWHIGGAVARVPEDATAFHGRHAAFLVNPEANWEHPEDDAANIAWVREFLADLRPFSDGSRYLNFAGLQEEGGEMMRRAYGPHYARLVELKRRYDPTNLFRLNQNIAPWREVP